MKEYFVVAMVWRWGDLNMAPAIVGGDSFAVAAADAPGCIGFLPVFDTEAAATEFARTQDGSYGVFRITPRAPEDAGG